ncbi:MAG: nucleoside-triphosphatase [Candidatus Kapaibacterium sp.]
MRENVYIISGEPGTGKTTFALRLIKMLDKEGIVPKGIISPGLLVGRQKIGYHVLDVSTGMTAELARRGMKSDVVAGSFGFNTAGLDFGNRALMSADTLDSDCIIIDEIGPLEINGGGWADAFDWILDNYHKKIIITARMRIIGAVKKKWDLAPKRIIYINNVMPNEFVNFLND